MKELYLYGKPLISNNYLFTIIQKTTQFTNFKHSRSVELKKKTNKQTIRNNITFSKNI